MPHTRKKCCYPKQSSFCNKLLFEVGITLILIQRESENTIWKADFKTKKYNASDFEKKQIQCLRFWIEKIPRVRFWIEKNSTRQIFKKNFALSVFEKNLKRIRFSIEILSSPQVLNSNLVPLHVLFTSFSSIQPCTVTAYNIFVNYIIALATVQTIVLALVFAKTLTFDFAMVSHFILCMGLIYAETCCY